MSEHEAPDGEDDTRLTAKERWDIRIGLFRTLFTGLSLIVSVAIFVVGQQWTTARENQLIEKRNAIEYQRRLWDERRAAYAELANKLGAIAADLEVGETVSAEARRAFDEVYWGAAILVENEDVELQMVRLRNDMHDLEKGRITVDRIKLRVRRIVDLSKQHLLKEVAQ